jgi:hypothetical protein
MKLNRHLSDDTRQIWLFKVSVRIQGRSERAAHAADRARVRRLAVARDGHANARRLARRGGSGRCDDGSTGAGWGREWPAADRHGLGDAAELPRQAVGRLTAVERRGRRRKCAGPPLQAQGRYASRATALWTALDLGASATLGQESWAGRWPALTGGAANPVADSTRRPC